jgi:CRP-like cAMP-binding protein
METTLQGGQPSLPDAPFENAPKPAERGGTADGAEVLKRCCLFQALDEASRQTLAARAHRRFHTPGDTIFNFGDPGQSIMAIVAGTVRISRPAANGKEIILGDIPAGQVLGEIAVLDGRERSATAVAVTRCELIVLDRRDILPFLKEHPELCLKLLELLCGKLRHSDERMSDIAFADLAVRLAKALLVYSGAGQHPHRKPKLSLSQTELAHIIGGTRESVNRQLREWQRQGVIDLKQGWIVVENATSLADLSRSA